MEEYINEADWLAVTDTGFGVIFKHNSLSISFHA